MESHEREMEAWRLADNKSKDKRINNKIKLTKEQLSALDELESFIRYNGHACYILPKLAIFKKSLGLKT